MLKKGRDWFRIGSHDGERSRFKTTLTYHFIRIERSVRLWHRRIRVTPNIRAAWSHVAVDATGAVYVAFEAGISRYPAGTLFAQGLGNVDRRSA